MRYILPLKYIDTVARTGSIRKAAEQLAITSTALNRRILSMEEELGVQLFERLARGVRLSPAGELFIHHARNQIADMERLKSQIADLSGVRRGHVSIVCGQALVPYFLPELISNYRAEHPAVTFSVNICDREKAAAALANYEADIALVFEPLINPEFTALARVQQQLQAMMSRDHPLANKKVLRWSDIVESKVAVPTKANGVRHLLETASMRTGNDLNIVIESESFDFLRNYVLNEQCLSFQIPIGLPGDNSNSQLLSIPVEQRDIPSGELCIGQLRSRNLSVASALFANDVVKLMDLRYGENTEI